MGLSNFSKKVCKDTGSLSPFYICGNRDSKKLGSLSKALSLVAGGHARGLGWQGRLHGDPVLLVCSPGEASAAQVSSALPLAS